MTVLIVLAVVTLLARGVGALGFSRLNSWPAAVRVGFAAMLLLTGSTHFTSMRHDFARMIPDAVPYPMFFVYFTGFCELLGAIGLLIPRLRLAAGIALVVFFILVLPANIHAANAGLSLRGEPVTPLIIRIPMQLLFIGLTFWSAIYARQK